MPVAPSRSASSPQRGPNTSPLLLAAHGSRDPRAATTLRVLADRVTALVAPQPVRLGFLELAEPLLEAALAEFDDAVTVVPLLLGRAYHASVDLPQRLAANGRVSTRISGALGPDPLFADVLAAHASDLQHAGADGFVLLAAGSSAAAANAEVERIAAALAHRIGAPIRAAFVTARPGAADACAALRAAGCVRPAVLPYFLAPGRLLDRGLAEARAGGAVAAAPVLAGHRDVARLAVRRARSASGPLRGALHSDATRYAPADRRRNTSSGRQLAL